MAYSVSLKLDKRKKNKANRHTIVLQVIVNRKMTSISTGHFVCEKDWDSEKREVKKVCKDYPNITRLNNILIQRRQNVLNLLIELERSEVIDVTPLSDIRKELLRENKKFTFEEFTQGIILDLTEKSKIGNARAHKHMLLWMKKYNDTTEILFEHITYKWLMKIENKYLAQGNSVNGLGVYLRTLRSVYNKAIKEGVVDKKYYPFDTYSIKLKPTRKRAISAEDLMRVRNAELTNMTFAYARNYFMLSYYLMGASFVDLAHLQIKNIQDNRILYRRKKTGQLYTIKITEHLWSILESYVENKLDEDYILPIITEDNIEIQHKKVRSKLRQYNKDLKKVAKHLDITSDSFTSYVSRHTFATVARDKDVPLQVISKMLGHNNLKTTEIYLDSLKDEVIDDALDKIFD